MQGKQWPCFYSFRGAISQIGHRKNVQACFSRIKQTKIYEYFSTNYFIYSPLAHCEGDEYSLKQSEASLMNRILKTCFKTI